jgi:hypothetical protein
MGAACGGFVHAASFLMPPKSPAITRRMGRKIDPAHRRFCQALFTETVGRRIPWWVAIDAVAARLGLTSPSGRLPARWPAPPNYPLQLKVLRPLQHSCSVLSRREVRSHALGNSGCFALSSRL